jgi:hypothetical protein
MNAVVANGSEMADGLAHRLPAELGNVASEALARLDRTEDIRFSPSKRRLALAGFTRNCCTVFDVAIDRSGPRPIIRIDSYIELRCDAFRQPHGFDFIDETTLVVANRAGLAVIVAIPDRVGEERRVTVSPLRTIRHVAPFHRLKTPGSVCVAGRSRSSATLLVCNNYQHRVSRHVVGLTRLPVIPRNRILLRHGLDIPDGIAMSGDRRWIAVSSHGSHQVLVYDAHRRLGPASHADGELAGVIYPHGLRFSANGSRLFVADAGAPHVHVYEAPGGDWRGRRAPSATIRVLDEATFLRGRANPQEGGPKGLDIDDRDEILAITCEEQPLAFFHLPSQLASAERGAQPSLLAD